MKKVFFKKVVMSLTALMLVFVMVACTAPETVTAPDPDTPPVADPVATPTPVATPAQPGALPSDADFAQGEFPFPLPTSTGFRTQEDVLANLAVHPHDPGTIIVGVGTTPAGNGIRGWGVNNTDLAMHDLIHGGRLLARTRDVDFFEWDPVIVREAWITENADGTRTYGTRLNDNLRWSDGEPITAYDYVFALMLNSSPEKSDLESTLVDGIRLVGFEDFNSGDSRTFSGIRLYDEFSFSFTFRAEFFPYFFSYAFAEVSMQDPLRPMPMHTIAPGVTITDNGSGVTWCENLTVDLLQGTLLDPDTGYRWYPVPSSGPYRFVSYDRGAQVYVLEINPYFIATWDGYMPSIQQIAIRLTQGAVAADELDVGSLHLTSIGITNVLGNEMLERGTHGATVFASNSIWQLRFFCDVGPMRFREVRQAIAWSIDRDEYSLAMTEGHGRIVNSMYLPDSWIHRNNRDWFEDNLTHHTFNLARATEYLVAGGWVLNEDGNPFVEGVDRVRHKEFEGELLPLEIIWAANPNLDVQNARLYTALVPNAAQIGMIIYEQAVQSVTAVASRTGFAPGDEEQYHMLTISSGHGAGTSYIPFWNIFQIEDEVLFNSRRDFFLGEQRLSDVALAMRNTDPSDRELFDERELELHVLIDYYRPALFFYVTQSRWMFLDWLQNFEMGTSWDWSHAIIRAYSDR